MAQILDHLSYIQKGGATMQSTDSGIHTITGNSKATTDTMDAMTTKELQRIDDLERQIDDMTQRRLEYLEKMQDQYMNVQVCLQSLTRTTMINLIS